MSWVNVCTVDDLTTDRGVAVLAEEKAVAIFLLSDGSLHAVDHHDPNGGAPVMARGLIGSTGGRPYVVSPLLKEKYDLRSGECSDQPELSIRTWSVRDIDGTVSLSLVA